MSEFQSDDEQVEAIKKWWKENGTSVIVGAVLGFGIIFGWQGWSSYQKTQGEEASALYSVVEAALTTGQTDKATGAAEKVISTFPETVYANFSALALAKLAYEKGDKDAALKQLQWSMDHAADSSLAELARLRMARLLIDMDMLDDAGRVIAASADTALKGEFAMLSGDLANLRGDTASARASYQKALENGVENMALLRIKLVEVGKESAS